jgi:hypothetical protein
MTHRYHIATLADNPPRLENPISQQIFQPVLTLAPVRRLFAWLTDFLAGLRASPGWLFAWLADFLAGLGASPGWLFAWSADLLAGLRASPGWLFAWSVGCLLGRPIS